MLSQLADLNKRGQAINVDGLNFMLAVIKDIEPRNQLEAIQMAAVHVMSMKLASRLANADLVPQQDSAERAFNKLTRTFVTQMEALKRCRASPEQNVTLQHVSVV